MALLGLMLALATPVVLSTLDRIQSDSSVRKIQSQLASTRSRAVAAKSTFLFQGDLETNQYWVNHPETGENSKTVQLDSRIQFREFQDGDASFQEGTFSVWFYPQGSTSGGAIVLEPVDTDSNAPSFLLTIDPVTGKSYLQHAS